MTTAQFATYFYANVAPQFQAVNGGNWIRVENLARDLAEAANTNLYIYTGVYEQLELENSFGVATPLWLESSEKIMVPKWLWKVIINRDTDHGIVMITLNNPFVRPNEVSEFCPNVCRNAELPSSDYRHINKGYTFCCEVAAFKRVVDVLPSNVRATNLMSLRV